MLSYYASGKILKTICGQTQYPFMSSAYLALSSTEPSSEGTNVTEPDGNGYARTLLGVGSTSATWLMGSDPVQGVITNAKEIHFNEATGNWGELAYLCIYDADKEGNLIAWGELGQENTEGVWQKKSISPTAETVVVLKKGDVRISIT